MTVPFLSLKDVKLVIGDWKLEIGNCFLSFGGFVTDSGACFCAATLAALGRGVA